MLRYNRPVRLINDGVAEHRQATHEHMSNVDIKGQARSQAQAHELSGSLTICEDAQGKPASRSFAHKKNRQCFSNGAEVCMWLGLSHRHAKHNENTLELMGSLTPCEDTKEM